MSGLDHYSVERQRRLRRFLLVVFCHGRVILVTFLAILVPLVIYVSLLPDEYEGRVKLMVNPTPSGITGEKRFLFRQSDKGNHWHVDNLRSEVELLKSRSLLQAVVKECGLRESKGYGGGPLIQIQRWFLSTLADESVPGEEFARAVGGLEQDLEVDIVEDAGLIYVSYVSSSPEMAASVPNSLVDSYLERRVELRGLQGNAEVFQKEAETHRGRLEAAEKELVAFRERAKVSSLEGEKERLWRRVSALEGRLQETRGEISVVSKRIDLLEDELEMVPSRLTTEIRTSSSALVNKLEGTLMELELKRTELLSKYQGDYPPVREVERQIAQTQAAIAKVTKNPRTESTTNRNPTHDWVRSELVRTRAEFSSLGARAKVTHKALREARERAKRLERLETEYLRLKRQVEMAKDNYVAYSQRSQEARVAETLDRQRIANVKIAERGAVPVFPSGPPRASILLIGGLVASLASLSLAFLVEYWRPLFRTPDDVETYLGIPVLAAVPRVLIEAPNQGQLSERGHNGA